ncbi:Uncharacterized protein FWK35_00009696 [Aphis craccivora]|uniref:Uncharacterized protein n=1 Tax=Aphis craccivora TaxID=307492 RepID=A0A6G0YWW7_APHCR|nr:Uncharacterized protein FWK35_00009696 [Aphis craccivora]
MLQFQTLGVVSDNKMNLVGELGRSFFEFPNSFQKRREKPKKKLRKTGNFYAKPNHCKYLKCSPNVYVGVIYIQLNFQKMLTSF